MTRRTPRRRLPLVALLALVSSLLLLLAAAGIASAATVVNGGFETGDFSGWTQQNETSAGRWYVVNGTTAPRSSGEEEIGRIEKEIEEAESDEEREELEEEREKEIENREERAHEGIGTVLPPIEGRFDAIADEEEVSSMILYQDVALEPGLTHQLSMYLNYRSFAPIVAPNTLEVGGPILMEKAQLKKRPALMVPEGNQQVRVDVMKAGSPVTSLNPADILSTVYATPTGAPQQIPWTHLTANLTPFAGQSVRIRIVAVDNEDFLNAGVDAVSITSAPPVIAPPSNLFSFGKAKKNAKTGSTTLTVNVPGPGTLSLAGVSTGNVAKASISAAKAKKPKKPKNAVKPASATATAAAAVTLTVKPTAAAKKYLKAKGALSAKVAVTFTPTGGTAKTVTTTVPLKLAKPKPKTK